MKRYIFVLCLVFTVMTAFAIPAKRGVKKTLTLADGTTVTASLCGDEYCHYWKTDDNRVFIVGKNNIAKEMSSNDFSMLRSKANQRKSAANAARIKRLNAANPARLSTLCKSPLRVGNVSSYIGEKKGLVILVNFPNCEMTSTTPQEDFNAQFNEVGYSKNNHIGSVHDYFYDQSYGQFDLDFDVVGPVTVSQPYSYYGHNVEDYSSALYGNDSLVCVFASEACKLADEYVNYADYDWDGDGYVDQVYIIYAGYGENNVGVDSETLWPEEWELSSGQYYGCGDGPITLDGTTIDTFAISCELSGSSGSTMNSIGTACHEFSHCLGYPDFYDTGYNYGWGMDAWDLMDYGSYSGPNGDGEVPTGYTSYERWVAGWLEPTELTGDEEVDSLHSLNEQPEAYIIYNDSVPTEYYLLENRKPTSWFHYLKSYEMSKTGLLVLHVDYDEDAWYNNEPNNDSSHQRMTIVPASNSKPTYCVSTTYPKQMYPYNENDSLTINSTPATVTFNANSYGRKFLTVGVENIAVNDDQTISFNTKKVVWEPAPEPVDTTKDQIVFYESFNICNGTGGNDDLWNGSVATAKLVADNDGWVSTSQHGGKQCAMFGSASTVGTATTPTFNYEGDVKISFKAAPWNQSKDGTDLKVSINGNEVERFTMTKGEWTTYSLSYKLTGETTITFTPSLRLFLDEVGVAKIIDPAGIREINYNDNDTDKVYNISGQRVNNDYKGIIIKNGKKILNR